MAAPNTSSSRAGNPHESAGSDHARRPTDRGHLRNHSLSYFIEAAGSRPVGFLRAQTSLRPAGRYSRRGWFRANAARTALVSFRTAARPRNRHRSIDRAAGLLRRARHSRGGGSAPREWAFPRDRRRPSARLAGSLPARTAPGTGPARSPSVAARSAPAMSSEWSPCWPCPPSLGGQVRHPSATHVCTPLMRSTVRRIHFLLSGAFTRAVR
jgi:hypothetical protein